MTQRALLEEAVARASLRVGSRTNHNSNYAALRDGWEQPKTTEANQKEMLLKTDVLGSGCKVTQICPDLQYNETLVHMFKVCCFKIYVLTPVNQYFIISEYCLCKLLHQCTTMSMEQILNLVSNSD